MSPVEITDDRTRGLDRFGLLLALVVAAITVLSFADFSDPVNDTAAQVSFATLNAVIGATFVLALRAAGLARRVLAPVEVLMGLAVAGSSLIGVLDLNTELDLAVNDPAGPGALFVLISLLTPIAVIRRLLTHRSVTTRTLLGAVSAYLLIALAGVLVFLFIDSLDRGSFFGTAEPVSTFTYFALTTITTLGYGDVAPVEPPARFASVVLAVVGQVYLVTFVAMIVGLYARTRPERSDIPSNHDTP